jgi:Phospholipase_D-nuclease N-terminal
MGSAIEALVLIITLTAISLATIALFDALTGPMSWRRKLGWCLLVLSLPLIGPILYYRRGAERPRYERRITRTDKDGR